MKYFEVTIEETLSRVIKVQAVDKATAFEEVNQKYRDGDITLDSEDLSGVDMSIEEKQEDSER